MTARRPGAVVALAVFTAAAILATWPLATTADTAVTGGLGDPLLTAFVLAWDADRAAHGFQGLWNAPILFPHPHTLAYSEHMLGIALFTTPLQWIAHRPILVFNAAFIASYAFAGAAMFLLARELWGRWDAALLAGLAFELAPYRFAQSPHLHVLVCGWMPLGLWALHRYFATGGRGWLALFTAAFLIQGFSNGYYFYFFLVPAAIVIAFGVAFEAQARAKVLADLGRAIAAVALVAGPVALVYYRLRPVAEFSRSPADLVRSSARLADYFRSPSGLWNWNGLIPSGEPERELFQGAVLTLFAMAGLGIALRLRRRDRTWRRHVITYGVILAAAVWLSLGPAGLAYSLLLRLVPGMTALRVPARLAIVVSVAGAALAGAGFAALFERLGGAARTAAILVVASMIVLEGQRGVPVERVPIGDRSWDAVAYRWLRDSPPGALLELDITQQDDFHPFTTVYQLQTLVHRHPIVNGYSGLKSTLQELLGHSASPLREADQAAAALEGLRAIGVRYVMLHPSTYANPAEADRAIATMRDARAETEDERRFGDVWAWRLRPPDARQQGSRTLRPIDRSSFHVRASHHDDRAGLALDGDPDTRWMTQAPQNGDEWIELTAAAPLDVARIAIETAPRSVTDYPRRLRVESRDDQGETRVLFDGVVADRLIEALAADEFHVPIEIDLPPNRTVTLTLRQTARGPAWWSIHELRLWQR